MNRTTAQNKKGGTSRTGLHATLVAGCLLALAAACGTTVPGVETGALRGGAADAGSQSGLGAPQIAGIGPSSAGTFSGKSGLGTGTQLGTGQSPGSGARGIRSQATSTAAPALRGQASSSTRGPIQIGFQVDDSQSVAYKAVGAANKPVDETQAVHAIVAWANAHGGIGGHPIAPILSATNAENGSFATQQQSACVNLTEDHHAYAVVTSPAVGGTDEMVNCLAQHHVMDIEENRWMFDSTYYRQLTPYLYRPSDVSPNRWVPQWVSTLAGRGFFSGKARVGVVRFNAPVFNRVDAAVLKPALARYRVTAQEAVISEPNSVADFGNVAAAVGSAVLKFRSLGINRVLFLQNAGELPYFWMPQAQSQSYFPEYGIDTTDLPNLLAAQYAPAFSGGAVGIGWIPTDDVNDQDIPAGNNAWNLCNQIMRKAGLANLSQNGWDVGAYCDGVFFLRDALKSGIPSNAADFAADVAHLGSSYESPLGFGPTRLGPGRFDGIAVIRDLAYDRGCTCFRYTSSPVSLS